MKIKVGEEVQVGLDPGSKIPNDPRKKLDGQVFVVKRRKDVIVGHNVRGIYFELYGAKSDKGIHYAFMEEDLFAL